jgi:hypothetical protein
MAIDRSNPSLYPPNIQAILKRPAPAAVILGQELLEVDTATGTVRSPTPCPMHWQTVSGRCMAA